MITFNVVKEQHGWAVRSGACMMTPFWSRDLAIREANCLADAIRRHGQNTQVVIECAEGIVPVAPTAPTVRRSTRPATRVWGLRAGFE